jgi:hypothetical protein
VCGPTRATRAAAPSVLRRSICSGGRPGERARGPLHVGHIVSHMPGRPLDEPRICQEERQALQQCSPAIGCLGCILHCNGSLRAMVWRLFTCAGVYCFVKTLWVFTLVLRQIFPIRALNTNAVAELGLRRCRMFLGLCAAGDAGGVVF